MTEKAMKDFIAQNVEYGDKIYLVTITEGKKGRMIARYATGFEAHELLGVLYETSLSIVAQIHGEDKPTVETIKKYFVRDTEAQE